MRSRSLVLFAALIASLSLTTVAAPALAAKPEVYTGALSNLAVGGHDPVAYFTEGAPVKGKAEFSTEYRGAAWRFATAENLAAFKANPEQYAPQFGGYCAWAVSQGYTAPGSPKAWTVVDGKLYLNYNEQVQADWLQDTTGFIAKANNNWPGVLGD